MRLDQELIRRKLCESRTEAQELIAGRHVSLDGEVCTKQTRQVTEVSDIKVSKRRNFVSRGGDKLEGALTHIYGNTIAIDEFCMNKRVLDVGSSTGGFTDCLLSHGVMSVDAVDIGTAQLHPSLKGNTKVSSFENTDIRNFKTEFFYDIIVADLSFIPLSYVIEPLISFAKEGTVFFLLLKPQFEVGKGNTKKGIVKDLSLVDTVLGAYIKTLEAKGLTSLDLSQSVIKGGDGNQEYFIFGIKE
jgi:23S rRNA (cytidine1920-2'-O)/16S rRNA (cytidine1409-2'-O)-methyltransferase